ncbi:hypothetical protein C664_16445 [Thauera sp. 63]|nr:hypothetical protein C664_16445 [Thauera sp. 63]
MQQPLGLGQQAARLLEGIQVGVEATDEVFGVLVQRGVDAAQVQRIGFAEFEKCLAAENLGVSEL